MPRPSHQRLVASALSGLLAAGATPFTMSVARADDPVRLLIVPFRPIQGQVKAEMGPKIEEVLVDELHNHDDVQVTSPTPAAPAPAPTAGPSAAATSSDGDPAVLDRIDKGEALVKKFKFKPGADALEAALADYEGLPAQVDVKVLREAYTQLALAQLRTGANDPGMESLGAVIRLAPDLPLGGGYPPPFKRAFEQEKHKLTSAARASVNIKGDGQIFLDSREQAAAPTTIDEVIPGPHFLRVQRADGSVWGLKLIVVDGENSVTIPESGEVKKPAAPVAVSEGGAFAGIAQNKIDDALIGEISKAGAEANAPFVLFGGLYKMPDGNIGLAPHLYSKEEQGEVALDAVSFDPDLVSAGIVTNKLTGKILEQLKTFGNPETLPAPVAVLGKPKPKLAAVVLVPVPTPKAAAPVVAPTRVITAVDPVAAGGLTASADRHDDEGSNNLLMFGLIGAGAAAVIAATVIAIVVVKNNSAPVTGSAALSFN